MAFLDTLRQRLRNLFGGRTVAQATREAVQAASGKATDRIKSLTKMATQPVSNLITPDELKPVLRITPGERKRQQEVIRARQFHDGDQGAKLTERLREWLGDDCEFSLNFAATVVSAMAERLIVEGVEADASTEAEIEKQTTWWKKIWKGSRLDAHQSDIHEDAVCEGEHFLVIDFDVENNRPRLTAHQRYTDVDVKCGRFAGDGEGIRPFYPNDDISQKPLFFMERWNEQGDNGKTQQMLCLYFPDQVVTYARTVKGWELLDAVDWKHPVTGEALGIPVVHFKNPKLRPEAKRGWALQRIINKLLIDLITVCDQAAFRIWLYFGWSPKDKDGNALTIAPARWIGSEKAKATDASAEAVEGADPTPMTEVLDSMIFKMASMTDTPASRLLVTRQIAAEGTQKQQEEPLLAKLRRRATGYGQTWIDAFTIARRLHNAFAVGEDELDESVPLEIIWEPFQARSLDEEKQEADIGKTRVETQILKQQIGISQKQSQRELDYSEAQIKQNAAEKADERQIAGDSLGKLFNSGQVN